MYATIPADLILWDVVEEHLDEAAFLFNRWEAALRSPDLTLQRLAETTEPRLLAHLDGLVVAGEPAVDRLLYPALEGRDRSQAFAAAFAMLDSREPSQIDLLFKALPDAKPTVAAGIQRALELSLSQGFESRLRDLLRHDRPDLRALALEVLGFRRIDPGPELGASLSDSNASVVTAALSAVGRLALAPWQAHVTHLLASSEPGIAEAALNAGMCLSAREAWSACRMFARASTGPFRSALLMLALMGGPNEHRLIIEALEDPIRRRAALWALGFCGSLEAADRCVRLMEDKEWGPLALEAFAGIVGVNAASEKLCRPTPPGDEELPPLEQDDLDADLSIGPDDALLMPDGEAVARWWKQHRPGLKGATRLLMGRPASQATLVWALEQAPMRRRHVYALELAIRVRGSGQVETSALSTTQLQQLGRMTRA